MNIFSFGEIWSSRDVELKTAVFWNMTSRSVVDIGIHGVIFQQIVNFTGICCACRSQWPRGIRRGSAAARLPGLRVRITSGAWALLLSVVSCQVEFSASGWWLVQRSPTDCDREGTRMRWPWLSRDGWAMGGGVEEKIIALESHSRMRRATSGPFWVVTTACRYLWTLLFPLYHPCTYSLCQIIPPHSTSFTIQVGGK